MSPRLSPTLLLRKPDCVLVAMAKGGSDAAFAAIVTRHRPDLQRHCRALLRDQRAEDAVQQTFIQALQALRSGTDVRELRPWLHRIAHNVALNELRRGGWDHDELSDEWADFSRSDELERRARLREALLAIESLPDRQRLALVHSAKGETPAYIAKALGVSDVAARQLVHRARVTVRAAARVFLPPPVVWFARRVSAAAERAATTAAQGIGTAAEKLSVPAIPVALAPLAPKVAAMVAAAALGAAPAALIAGAHPGDSESPAAANASSGSILSAGDVSLTTTPSGPTGIPGVLAGGGPRGGANVAGSGPSPSAPGPGDTGAGGATTTGPALGDPTATDASATDPTATDASATDASATDPTATDASATDTTATDTTATDTTATDTTATDTTTTDTTATDTTATDTTTTDTTVTDTTATDTTAAAPASP